MEIRIQQFLCYILASLIIFCNTAEAQLDKVPACALPCLNEHITNLGCPNSDFVCSCRLDLLELFRECASKDCNEEGTQIAYDAVVVLCESIGIDYSYTIVEDGVTSTGNYRTINSKIPITSTSTNNFAASSSSTNGLPTSTSNNDTSTSKTASNTKDIGVIIGGSVGGLAAIISIILAIWLIIHKRNRDDEKLKPLPDLPAPYIVEPAHTPFADFKSQVLVPEPRPSKQRTRML